MATKTYTMGEVAKFVEAAPQLIEVAQRLAAMANEKVTIRKTHEIATLARLALEKAGIES